MEIRVPSCLPVAAVLSPSSLTKNPCQTQPEMIWASLKPEQQQTVLRTIVTICRGLVPHRASDEKRKEVRDEQP